jgi:hypothetical protein
MRPFTFDTSIVVFLVLSTLCFAIQNTLPNGMIVNSNLNSPLESYWQLVGKAIYLEYLLLYSVEEYIFVIKRP